jgi:hypothetical protein
VIPASADTLVLRPSRPGVAGLAPTPVDLGTAEDVVKIGAQKIGTFKIGEGTYDDFADPATEDTL